MKYGTLALIFALGLSLLGGIAQAQTGVGSTISVGVDASIDSDSNSEGSQETTGEASMKGSDTSENDSSVSADAQTESALGFTLLRRSLDRDSSGEGSATVRSASEVNSNDSFRAFAETSMRNDDKFSGVLVDDNGMEMTYRRDARFLGFIPSGMNVRVHVDGNGDVAVRYPWYSFLMSSSESRVDLEARIKAEIASMNDGPVVASTDEDGSTDQGFGDVAVSGTAKQSRSDSMRWARVLERIQAALSAEADVTANS